MAKTSYTKTLALCALLTGSLAGCDAQLWTTPPGAANRMAYVLSTMPEPVYPQYPVNQNRSQYVTCHNWGGGTISCY